MAFSSPAAGSGRLNNASECLPFTVRDIFAAVVVGAREAILPGLVWFWIYNIANTQVVPDGGQDLEFADQMERAALIAAAFLMQLPLYAAKYAFTERKVAFEIPVTDSAEVVVAAPSSEVSGLHWLAEAFLKAMPDTLGDIAFPISNTLWNSLLHGDFSGKLLVVALGDGVVTGSANLVLRAVINCCRSKEGYRTPWPAAASTALGSLGFTLAEGAADTLKLSSASASLLILAGVAMGQFIVVWLAMPSRANLAKIIPAAESGAAASLRQEGVGPEHVQFSTILGGASRFREGPEQAAQDAVGGKCITRQLGQRNLTGYDSDDEESAGGSAAARVETSVASRGRGRQSCLAWLASWCSCEGSASAATSTENPLGGVEGWTAIPTRG